MRGAIDKLDGFLHESVKIVDVLVRAQALGLEHKLERIGKSRKWAHRIGPADGEHVYLGLRFSSSPYTSEVLSNPRHFGLFRRYQEFFIRLFGLNQWECFKLFRIDFAVDLFEDFDEFIKWLLVRFKRDAEAHVEYDERGAKRTGVIYGHYPHQIVVYDKREEQRIKGIETDGPITRIEARLWGDARPVKEVKELPSILGVSRDGCTLQPFRNVSIEKLTTVPFSTLHHRPKKLVKLVRFATWHEIGGRHLAVKKMNAHGNFARDLKGLYRLEEYPHNLNDILIDGLEEFFERRSTGRIVDEVWDD